MAADDDPTPTQQSLTPQQVFDRVAPSVVFIETPIGSGSGLLYDARRVVTNAHVVWPFDSARVVFADGTEFNAATVVAWDLMADIAVLELPDPVAYPPVEVISIDALPIGSELFLIGYPAEGGGGAAPQPSITRGLLSRFREWQQADITYLQTDAAIAGGQSGGALVSSSGSVVGVSGFSFSEANFALAAAASTVMRRVERMLNGEDVDQLGDRLLPMGPGTTEFELDLDHFYDERAFILRPTLGATVTVTLDGTGDGIVFIIAADAVLEAEADEGLEGVEIAEFSVSVEQPYFVVAGQFDISPGSFRLTSSEPLVPFLDPDDGQEVGRGVSVGNLDYPGDRDFFFIELMAGESITITVDSPNFDPEVTVDLPDNPDGALAYDDDGGDGLFGTNARLSFTAPRSGRYLIVVGDVFSESIGGYFLLVE